MGWFGHKSAARPAGDDLVRAADLAARPAGVPQEERVAVALMLVRDICAPGCVGALLRLARLAQSSATRILRDEFERESG